MITTARLVCVHGRLRQRRASVYAQSDCQRGEDAMDSHDVKFLHVLGPSA